MQLDLFTPPTQQTVTPAMWTGVYDVRKNNGTRRFHYYRFYWMEGDRTSHIHIPGGDINHPRVRDRVAQVEKLIQAGQSPDEICQLIRTWSDGRGSNLNRRRFVG